MGVGRMAIAIVLLGFLAFAFVSAFSMAQQDKTHDQLYNSSTNAANNTAIAINQVTGTSANLFVPIIAIAGIVLLAAFFMVFRKVR